MRERLKEFMDKKALSAKQFAESIDVQPSSVSHILTGRNKPSIDFIEKLIKSFPDIDLKYLLTGITSVEDAMTPPVLLDESKPLNTSIKEVVKEEASIENTNVISDSEIKEIVTFYKDGTFEIYRPKN